MFRTSNRLTPLALLVVALSLGAPTSAFGKSPLKLSSTSLDFGSVGHDETVARKLTITNTGTKPVRIVELRPSCGCTKVSPRQIRQPIAAGASVDVNVTMSSGRATGKLHKYVAVRSDQCDSASRVGVLMKIFSGYQVRGRIKLEGEFKGKEVSAFVDLTRQAKSNEPIDYKFERVVTGYGRLK
ncbi:MAG: DUF1573 domain-containing protein, partial [Planctomycetota bacterium]